MAGHIEERVRRDGSISYRLVASLPRRAGTRRAYLKRTLPPGTSRRVLEHELAKLVAEADGTVSHAGRQSTLRDLYREWWELAAVSLSPYTRTGYERDWRLRIEPRLGDIRVAELTRNDVERWLAWLATRGNKDGGPLAYNTVRNARVTLAAMLTQAARWGWITQPHAARDVNVPGTRGLLPDRAPDKTVLAVLLSKLVEEDLELFTFERVAATTGGRRGEVAALRIDDIDTSRSTVLFDEAVKMERVDDGGGGRRKAVITIGPPKTGRARAVVLDDRTLEIVESWVELRRHAARELKTVLGRDALLFSELGEWKKPRHPDSWSRRWRRWCGRNGVTGIRQHDLRHGVGQALADVLPLPAVQERLGHQRLTTTQRYAHADEARGREAADVMARHLDGPKSDGSIARRELAG